MKNLIIALFGSIVVLSSCSNDLNLIAPWKRIPIVYGFLNLADTTQYIRVEKAFLDPSVSALTVAQIPDSLYFDNIEVTLTRLSNNTSWVLQRINGNDAGFPKKPGVFANDPNYLYKIRTDKMVLKANEAYKLTIKSLDSGTIIGESTTNVVGVYTFLSSAPPNPITWPYPNDVRFSWYSSEIYGKISDLKLVLNYTEFPAGDPSKFVKKSLEWIIETNIIRPDNIDDRISVATKGVTFFKYLNEKIEHNPDVKRQFLTIDIYATIGGQEFKDYLDLVNASSGITSAQIVPTYSNITNGKGIFSSRYSLVGLNYSLSKISTDSLKAGIYTKVLNFQ